MEIHVSNILGDVSVGKILLLERTFSSVLLRVISGIWYQASQQLPWHLAHGHRRDVASKT